MSADTLVSMAYKQLDLDSALEIIEKLARGAYIFVEPSIFLLKQLGGFTGYIDSRELNPAQYEDKIKSKVFAATQNEKYHKQLMEHIKQSGELIK